MFSQPFSVSEDNLYTVFMKQLTDYFEMQQSGQASFLVREVGLPNQFGTNNENPHLE